MNVGILIFDGVQLTDFTGPYDVFNAARSGPAGEPGSEAFFTVFTLAPTREVRSSGGLAITADYSLDEHPPIELLLVPGGQGTRREENNPALVDWIRDASQTAMIAATVCTGARLMANTGLWDGLKATTHWASIEFLRNTFPAVEVIEGVRYVDSGKYVSSAGVTAGFDLALHLVERLHGREVAARAARLLEYDYWEGNKAASG